MLSIDEMVREQFEWIGRHWGGPSPRMVAAVTELIHAVTGRPKRAIRLSVDRWRAAHPPLTIADFEAARRRLRTEGRQPKRARPVGMRIVIQPGPRSR